MANEYTRVIEGHPNIYTGYTRRNLVVHICEPTTGIDHSTGFCLLIHGFGANSGSKVYRKMRSQFADQHNLVTIQCDYFGCEFLGDVDPLSPGPSLEDLGQHLSLQDLTYIFEDDHFHAERLKELKHKYEFEVTSRVPLNESLNSFNDMGIMQALDNLVALLDSIHWAMQKHGKLNCKRVIAYGHSHGAYLSLLCNAFAPKLLSLLIDNSAWLLPNYLVQDRLVSTQEGPLRITSRLHYLASTREYDFQLLCLPLLYSKFNNECEIVTFQGTSDALVVPRQKQAFCRGIDRCSFFEIGPDQIDGQVFRGTDHGLGANFLHLFQLVMNSVEFQTGATLELPSVTIETETKRYQITYEKKTPFFVMHDR